MQPINGEWIDFIQQKPEIGDFCLFAYYKGEGYNGFWVTGYKGEKLFVKMMETAKAKWVLLPLLN